MSTPYDNLPEEYRLDISGERQITVGGVRTSDENSEFNSFLREVDLDEEVVKMQADAITHHMSGQLEGIDRKSVV